MKLVLKGIWVVPVIASIFIITTLGFQEAESTTVVNVDFGDGTIDTNGGRVCGSAVDAYLAGFGITAVDDPANIQPRGFCILQFDRSTSQHAIASSLPNFFFRDFGNDPYRYSLVFDTPLDSFQFTRTSYDTSFGGIATFEWNAQAFDSNGNRLGPQVGERTQGRSGASPPVVFPFSGPDIARVDFFGPPFTNFCCGITQVPIDDLILTVPTTTPPTPTITCGVDTELQGSECVVSQALRDQITNLEVDLATAQSDLATAQDDLAQAEADRDQALAELAAALNDIVTLQGDLVQAIQDFGNALADLAAAQTTITAQDATIANLESDLATAEQTIEDLEAEVEELGLPGAPVANQGGGQGVPAQGKNNKP